MSKAPHAAQELPVWAQDVLAKSPPLLDRNEAATLGRLSKKTIDRRIKDRTLAAVKNGRRVLVPTRALLEFLARGGA